MPFLDLNGDGNIDPEETAIGIVLLDDEDDGGPPSGNNNNPGCGCLGPGCLTTAFTVILISAIIGIVISL